MGDTSFIMKAINITLLCILSLVTLNNVTADISIDILPETFVLYKAGSKDGADPAAGIQLVEQWLILQEVLKISPQAAFVALNHTVYKDLKLIEAALAPVLRRVQANEAASENASGSKMVELSGIMVVLLFGFRKFI